MSQLGWDEENITNFYRSRFSFSETAGESVDAKYKESLCISGLDDNCSLDDIRKAYRKLVKENHPDMFAHMGDKFQESAAERFHAIKDAYNFINENYQNKNKIEINNDTIKHDYANNKDDRVYDTYTATIKADEKDDYFTIKREYQNRKTQDDIDEEKDYYFKYLNIGKKGKANLNREDIMIIAEKIIDVEKLLSKNIGVQTPDTELICLLVWLVQIAFNSLFNNGEDLNNKMMQAVCVILTRNYMWVSSNFTDFKECKQESLTDYDKARANVNRPGPMYWVANKAIERMKRKQNLQHIYIWKFANNLVRIKKMFLQKAIKI